MLVLKPIHEIEKQYLIETRPRVYFLTDHYRGSDAILICLASVDGKELRDLLIRAWRALAPAKLRAAYDQRKSVR